MYKLLFKFFPIVFAFLMIYGCSDDGGGKIVSSLEPLSLSFKAEGGSANVELTTGAYWYVNILEGSDWCQVTPSTGSGDASVTVAVKKNVIPMPQTAKLAFMFDGQTIYMTITQEALVAEGAYADGEVRIYEQNRQEKPVNLVFLGDGFTAADYLDGGSFDAAVAEAAEAIFQVEPYKAYREYFNIYKMAAFSEDRGVSQKDEGIIKKTAFNTAYLGGSSMETDYNKIFKSVEQIPGINLKQTGIILIVNEDRYAGMTMMYSDGRSIAMCPMDRTPYLPGGFGHIVVHEAGGHGFGRLADEYTNGVETPPSQDELTGLKQWFAFGYYQNVDITNDLSKVKWKDFVSLPGYVVNAYEGGYYHEVGIWRPESVSCMDDNRYYFNAPSRAAIVQRILSIAGEPYTLEGFIAKDVVKVMPSELATRTPLVLKLPRLAPPVMVDVR